MSIYIKKIKIELSIFLLIFSFVCALDVKAEATSTITFNDSVRTVNTNDISFRNNEKEEIIEIEKIVEESEVIIEPVDAQDFDIEKENSEEEKEENKKFSINLDKETIAKGYTVTSFEDTLKLSLVPGILNESTKVDCEIIEEDMPMPWNLKQASEVYQFEFRNKNAYDNHKPFYIQFSYDSEDTGLKRVFFYDKTKGTWRELPTKDYPKEKFVRSLIHLPYARIVVLSDENVMASGKASWYAYKGGDFAASPDFPKGSKLRVFNLENDKHVDIVVNDYGPERDLFPDRAIDLDKVAFSKISSVGSGIIDIKIEPLYIVPDERGRVLGIDDKQASIDPETKSKATIVMNEKTGDIIYEKNAEEVLPLASLSKLVAVSVFLDQGIDLEKEVAYKKQDENYNNEHCNPWESSRLKLNEGEVLTVEDIVYSSLVGSRNNAVESLVRASGLERQAFIKKMNETVQGWGAVNTSFVEPTGLAPANVSSAHDYAIITREVFKNSLIEKVSTAAKYDFYTKNTKTYHKMYNTNHFIRNNFFASNNNLKITGSKTGYLDEAKYCLVTRATGSSGEKVIVTNFGANSKTESFEEVKELLKYGIKKIK